MKKLKIQINEKSFHGYEPEEYCKNIYTAQAVYKCSAIPVNIPVIFTQKEETTLKFVWNHKTPLIAKSTWSKKNKSRGITIPNFKLYYKAIVIKTLDSGKK